MLDAVKFEILDRHAANWAGARQYLVSDSSLQPRLPPLMDVAKHQLFAERLVRNQHRVFAYMVTLVSNRADAEELFQQTCLTLWEHWERYDPALDFVPWACGFAHNHVRNFLRKRQSGQIQLDADVVELLAERMQQRLAGEDDRLAALRQCLDRLSAGNRGLIEAYYSGRTVGDLAKSRSSSNNAVYKLLQRLRDSLHECVSLRLATGAAE